MGLNEACRCDSDDCGAVTRSRKVWRITGMDVPAAKLPTRGYLYVVLAAFMWAVSGSTGKFLFMNGVTPQQVVQLRVTLGVPCLLAWFLVKNPGLLRIGVKDIFYFMVLGIVGLAMVQYGYFYAISRIHVGVAILLEYLAPAFIAVYYVVVAREKLTRTTLVAVGGSVVGCYLAVGGYHFDLLALNWQGICAGIGAGAAFALYAVQGEYGMRRYGPWTVFFYALLFAAIFWNIAIPPLQSLRHHYTLGQWICILYIVVGGTVVSFGLYTAGISLIRSTRASITATLEPITAGLISFAFLGETLGPLQVLGGVLVIGAVVLLQLNREHDENTPELIRGRQAREVPAKAEEAG